MRVLYVQYTNPGAYPPLVRGATLLAESGAEVRMLGTRVRDTGALDVSPSKGIEVRLVNEAPEGWRLKAHYARYGTWVAREAAAWKPDWIYASDLLSTPIALAAAAITAARVVYHEHDAPATPRPNWIVKRCLDARGRLLRTASIVVAPNADRAARLSAMAGGRPVLTVWNCPRRPTRKPHPTPPLDVLRIVFCGSINSERLPLAVVEALARAKAPLTLDVAGYETVGSRGYIAALAEHARNLGVEERVRYLGAVSEDDWSVVFAQCDIGLALMPMASSDENMRHMAGASNKPFEYLSCGVVPLVSDLPDWRRTFVEPGYALVCDPSRVESIAAAFEWAASHRAAVRDLALRGWERLRLDWNYESQFAPVLDAMWGRSAERSRWPSGSTVEAECVS
jgi:glycosyltransferase involved in cell wall biosynthesis